MHRTAAARIDCGVEVTAPPRPVTLVFGGKQRTGCRRSNVEYSEELMNPLLPLPMCLAVLVLIGCDTKHPATESDTAPWQATGSTPPPGTGAPVAQTQDNTSSKSVKVPAVPEIVVNISDNVLEIKGQKLTWENTLADLEKLFGKPSKVNDEKGLFNHSAVWHELGIYALVTTDTKQLVEITFRLGNASRNYRSDWPKQTFTGKLTIDGVAIRKDSDIAEVARTTKGPPIKQMEGEDKGHYWGTKRKTRNDGLIGIETDDDKGKGVRHVYFSMFG
jgi:hypothetical protein